MTVPVSDGVTLYHTVRPIVTLLHGFAGVVVGSLASVLATIVFWPLLYGSDEASRALAKLSLIGGVPATIFMLSCPGVKSSLPAWM